MPSPVPSPLDDSRRLFFTQREAATALSTTRYRIAQLLDAGELVGLTLGGPRLVTRRSLEEFQEKLSRPGWNAANDSGPLPVHAG